MHRKTVLSKTSVSKGAVTLEAAIVLPVVLCAFFSVVFLIRAAYTYSLIHHALSETALEMASAGYIYHISG
ncbi:MAG TPA: pilus assembly protein, partial [Clostridiales bacterium]|nr:pilus assembly protein [Clostridiales bacterium]